MSSRRRAKEPARAPGAEAEGVKSCSLRWEIVHGRGAWWKITYVGAKLLIQTASGARSLTQKILYLRRKSLIPALVNPNEW